MLVMNISRHSPESCPAFEKKNKDTFLNMAQNMTPLAKKHNIKVVGMWVDLPGHTVYIIFDTPHMEDLMALSKEPVIMAAMSFQTSVLKPLASVEEALAIVKG